MPDGVERDGDRSESVDRQDTGDEGVETQAGERDGVHDGDDRTGTDRRSVNARMDENAGRPVEDDEAVACPYCDSTDTHLENARGPSLCRTIYHCDACDSPFERFG